MISDSFQPVIHEVREPAFDSRIFLLREDLLGGAFGGNKLLIAREYIRDLREQGKDAMLLYGDRRSNLCRVLALLCESEGIPARMLEAAHSKAAPAGLSSGDEAVSAAAEHMSLNERLIRGSGVEISPCGPDVAESVDRELQSLKDKGYDPYYIFGSRLGTGNEGTAARAYARRWKEIQSWEQEQGIHFDLIAVPYGTGCTYGGLLAGMLETGDVRKTLGVSISSRTRERAEQILADTVRDYFRKEGKEPPAENEIRGAMNLTCDFNCGGYGLWDAEVQETVRGMLRRNGVGLPLIYGGKAYHGLMRHLDRVAAEGKEELPSAILFLHTGGTPLFFDDLAKGYL